MERRARNGETTSAILTASCVETHVRVEGRDGIARRIGVAVALLGVLGLGAPLPCRAIAVSSPADLLLADFWVYVEGTNGAFARVEARDSDPVSLDIQDPVVGGVPFEGHLLLSAEALPTGPATKVNAVLASDASGAINTDLDLTSLLTFDLAVLSGTASNATVGIVGSGLGGAAGYQGDGIDGSQSRSSGYVTLYTTNAAGGFGSIVRTWEIPGNFTTTPITGEVTLDTNQLYRIVVRSLASVDIRTPATLNQYAYLFIDPQLSLIAPTQDAELVVSANLPEAIPEPTSVLLAGAAALAICVLARLRRPQCAP